MQEKSIEVSRAKSRAHTFARNFHAYIRIHCGTNTLSQLSTIHSNAQWHTLFATEQTKNYYYAKRFFPLIMCLIDFVVKISQEKTRSTYCLHFFSNNVNGASAILKRKFLHSHIVANGG